METNEQHVLQKHLVQFLLKDVFNMPSLDEHLQIKSGTDWTIRGVKLTIPQINGLRMQAIEFRESQLWKILKQACQEAAYINGCKKATTEADMIAAKVLHYFTDVVESKIEDMTKT